jgi:AdoMet-dependent heme synthase
MSTLPLTPTEAEAAILRAEESRKRADQSKKRPRVHEKIQKFHREALNGVISPILRLKLNRSLCNFQCQHCCEEPYMSRDIKARTGDIDPRKQMEISDYAALSREADEYGIFRFVLTGGEVLIMKDLGDLIQAVDPYKHLVVLDTNGWTLDEERAKWFADIGGYKVQISLDSFVEAEHDAFRRKPGSYKRVMRAIKAAKEAGLELLLSTCLVKDRVFSQEFADFTKFCKDNHVPQYVSLAKPVGSARQHLEWVCTKHDIDRLKAMEDEYNIFTHMSPSYGHPGKCITVKGINTVNHDGEIMPCPYMDMSIGNVMREPLRVILERGMKHKWLGPHRDECIIGENFEFIDYHNKVVADHLKETPYLPVPYEKGFGQTESV